MPGVRLAVVADADAASRAALATLLGTSGLAVVECSDGRRLWDLLADNRRAYVVFADALLPGLEGAELARRVAATRELRRLTVVVTTAKADPAMIGRLLATGVTAVVPKPYTAVDVQSALLAVGRAAERRLLSSSSVVHAAVRRPRPVATPPSEPLPPEVNS